MGNSLRRRVSSPTMTRLARRSVALYSSLELDGQPCFHAVGGIEVAATPSDMADALLRAAKAMGVTLS